MVSFPSPAANDHNVALVWGLAYQKMELTVQSLTTEEIITAHLEEETRIRSWLLCMCSRP